MNRNVARTVVVTSALFLASYAHSLYGAFQKPHPYPELELHRLPVHPLEQPEVQECHPTVVLKEEVARMRIP